MSYCTWGIIIIGIFFSLFSSPDISQNVDNMIYCKTLWLVSCKNLCIHVWCVSDFIPVKAEHTIPGLSLGWVYFSLNLSVIAELIKTNPSPSLEGFYLSEVNTADWAQHRRINLFICIAHDAHIRHGRPRFHFQVVSFFCCCATFSSLLHFSHTGLKHRTVSSPYCVI